MIRRHHAIVLAFVVPTLAASLGCSDDEKATPQVIFEGEIKGNAADCAGAAPLFSVGSFGNLAANPPVAASPVPDGSAFSQGAASISCSVVPAGNNEFTVAASVVLSGATGGLFRVDGPFKTGSEQTDIHAIFSTVASGNKYEQLDRKCRVRYATTFQGVASGRVWGEITCPNAVNVNADKTCEVTARFRFENCDQ